MSSIKGIYAASMSIFKEDFSLNLEQTKKHAENLIDKGCHGVAVLGSTGQAQLISVKEKMELIEYLSNSSKKDKFIIGTLSPLTVLLVMLSGRSHISQLLQNREN